jgi:dihydroflavonol-4-reductase
VIHTAALFSFASGAAGEVDDVAVDGTDIVLNAAAAAGVRRAVVTSSSVTRGSSARMELRDEQSPFEDADPPAYFLAKARQEERALAVGRERGLEVVCVLPTMTVGPYDLRLGPANSLIINYLADPFRVTYGGGVNVVSVRDVALGHALAAERGQPGACYLLGADNLEYSMLYRHIAELAGVPGPRLLAGRTAAYMAATGFELLASLTGKPAPFTRAQALTLGRFYWYSSERAKRELGYAPRSSREAVADALGWLATSRHVSSAIRRSLRLAPEVYASRAADLEAYRSVT